MNPTGNNGFPISKQKQETEKDDLLVICLTTTTSQMKRSQFLISLINLLANCKETNGKVQSELNKILFARFCEL